MSKTKPYRPPVHKTHDKDRFLYLMLAIAAAAILSVIVMVVFAPKAGAQVSITAEGTGDVGNAGILGPVIVTTLAVTFVKTIVDFPAYIRAKDWDWVTKNSLGLVAGIAVAFLLQATDFAKDFQLAGVVLADTNPATVVFFGLSLASAASVLLGGVMAAIDNTRSSAVPQLVKSSSPANDAG